MTIKANLHPLGSVDTLTYLGRITAHSNRNWEALYKNLRKSQRRWGVVSMVIVKSGVMVQARAVLYKDMVHMVMPYCSDS